MKSVNCFQFAAWNSGVGSGEKSEEQEQRGECGKLAGVAVAGRGVGSVGWLLNVKLNTL